VVSLNAYSGKLTSASLRSSSAIRLLSVVPFEVGLADDLGFDRLPATSLSSRTT